MTTYWHFDGGLVGVGNCGGRWTLWQFVCVLVFVFVFDFMDNVSFLR